MDLFVEHMVRIALVAEHRSACSSKGKWYLKACLLVFVDLHLDSHEQKDHIEDGLLVYFVWSSLCSDSHAAS